MCGTVKHTTEDHVRRATLGRFKSKKWKACLSSSKKRKQMQTWWKKHYAEMCEKRKLQAKVHKKSYSKAMKKKWADPEYYAKMCKIRKTQSKGNMIRHPKGSWYRCKYGGICGSRWMRSSWEVAFALWLDNCGIKWEYETKRFCLGRTYYTPDFYLPDQDQYVELKGWFTKKGKQKMDKFKEMYPDINLYMFFEKHLGKVLEFKPRKVA